jgi:D-threo-aldose 1-dehydrogenase
VGSRETEPMHQIKLPSMEIHVSRIGFGTSMLMSRLNRQQSERLLYTALDAGITHFDTAPLYGYGEAERALGDAIKGRRETVTVTTKVGILPPKRSPLLTIAKYASRKVAARIPHLRARLRQKAQSMVVSGVFDILAVTRSLENSLRQLQTDYVDFLLLHECSEADLQKPELLEFLRTVQHQGKVRYYGVATTAPSTQAALSRFPEYAPVVQFPNSAFERNIETLDLHTGPAIFTHSSLSFGFAQFCSELATHPPSIFAWNERLGVNCLDRRALGEITLQYAMYQNPNGVVLFSSTSQEHIRANAATASKPLSAPRMRDFLELVESVKCRQSDTKS